MENKPCTCNPILDTIVRRTALEDAVNSHEAGCSFYTVSCSCNCGRERAHFELDELYNALINARKTIYAEYNHLEGAERPHLNPAGWLRKYAPDLLFQEAGKE
jgi:hypothetical protein